MYIDILGMPSTSRALLFASVFALTDGLPWTGPRPTTVYEVAGGIPQPTLSPRSLAEVLERRSVPASVCGWLNGDPSVVVACASASSCVWDTSHRVVGCVPEDPKSSTAIYTSCAQGPGAIKATSNPLDLTCIGSQSCYRNNYASGYFQYGCGGSAFTSSVSTSFWGMDPANPLAVVSTEVKFPASVTASTTAISPAPTPDAAPPGNNIGQPRSPDATVIITSTLASSPTASSTAAAIAAASGPSTAVIAGATIGSLAGLLFISTAIYLLLRYLPQHRPKKEKAVPARDEEESEDGWDGTSGTLINGARSISPGNMTRASTLQPSFQFPESHDRPEGAEDSRERHVTFGELPSIRLNANLPLLPMEEIEARLALQQQRQQAIQQLAQNRQLQPPTDIHPAQRTPQQPQQPQNPFSPPGLQYIVSPLTPPTSPPQSGRASKSPTAGKSINTALSPILKSPTRVKSLHVADMLDPAAYLSRPLPLIPATNYAQGALGHMSVRLNPPAQLKQKLDELAVQQSREELRRAASDNNLQAPPTVPGRVLARHSHQEMRRHAHAHNEWKQEMTQVSPISEVCRRLAMLDFGLSRSSSGYSSNYSRAANGDAASEAGSRVVTRNNTQKLVPGDAAAMYEEFALSSPFKKSMKRARAKSEMTAKSVATETSFAPTVTTTITSEGRGGSGSGSGNGSADKQQRKLEREIWRHLSVQSPPRVSERRPKFQESVNVRERLQAIQAMPTMGNRGTRMSATANGVPILRAPKPWSEEERRMSSRIYSV